MLRSSAPFGFLPQLPRLEVGISFRMSLGYLSQIHLVFDVILLCTSSSVGSFIAVTVLIQFGVFVQREAQSSSVSSFLD